MSATARYRFWRTYQFAQCPRCDYCDCLLASECDATIDHIHPRSQRRLLQGMKGGINGYGNLALSCGPCNVKKGGKTLWQANLKLLRKRPAQEAIQAWAKFCQTNRNRPSPLARLVDGFKENPQ